MSNDRKFRLRCTYVKQGRLAYLSHLEIARALERCVRRAGLPFGVSQGFSPHMLLQFGSALPVGIGSTCEIFDVTLRDYVSPRKALEKLQRACVPDLAVQACNYVDNRAKAASVVYPVSTYSVIFDECPRMRQDSGANPDEFPEAHSSEGTNSDQCFSAHSGTTSQSDTTSSACDPVLEFPETVTLIKKKKERVMRVSDFLVDKPTLDGRELIFSLIAKPEGSLRPDRLLEAVLAQYNANVTADCKPLRILSFARIAQREK